MPVPILEYLVPPAVELLSVLTVNTLLPTSGFANLCSVTLTVGTWEVFGRMSVTNVNANGTLNLYIGGGSGNGGEIVGTLTMRSGVSADSGVSGSIVVTSGSLICRLRSSGFNSGFTNPTALVYNPVTGVGTYLRARKEV